MNVKIQISEVLHMARKKQTPSPEVDQKKLINDRVKELRANNFEDDHTRRVTPNGADGQ
jgi:hypothetical protein